MNARETGSLDLLATREVAALAEAGHHTAASLLDHLPRRHEDRRRFDRFPDQPSTMPVCLRGRVVDAIRRPFARGRGCFEAVVMDGDGSGGLFGSGRVTCRWFNMPFIHKIIAAGQEMILHGRVKESGGRLVIDHPEFEILADDAPGGDSIHLERIVPVYRNISGIPQRRLREIIHLLLMRSDPASLEDPCALDVARPRAEVVHDLHFPASMEAAEAARRHVARETFFRIQLNAAWRRARHRGREGRVLGKRTRLLKAFHQSLPFELTGAQKRSIHEIVADMRSPAPMSRLLQGDVGAGKTFVAMAAMLLAVDSGCQAALMAPTQILAEQHFLTFRRWLEPLGVRLVLRTAGRHEVVNDAAPAESSMIIGTHALLHDDSLFGDLGLVVIDEQHKFGVGQRAALVRRGMTPDLLVMTATPIPRTLTLTLYGDLDVSLLDEKPPGRGVMVTAVRAGAKQRDVTAFVAAKLAEGRQAYLVYPMVEEDGGGKEDSATEAFAKWRKRLPGHQVGLLHGRMRAEEKEQVMTDFREGRIHALVSTTVIEVGVDVPNATLMVLHHAERFGLAQIHQLRGRIGRGGHKGHCLLLTGGDAEALEKLAVLERCTDGFEIAEEDLRLRGPGDILGTAQSGLGTLRFAEYLADTTMLREVRAQADRLLAEDPSLDGPHRRLRPLIVDPAAADGGDVAAGTVAG
jgi:ATP-dependent DNA helicase RecG